MRKYRAITAYNLANNEVAIIQGKFKYQPVSSGPG